MFFDDNFLLLLCVGFIEVIVAPAYQVCGDIMEIIVKALAREKNREEKEITDYESLRVWHDHIATNKLNWKQQCKHK